MMKLNCLPFFPTTDSGDVSSIKDVDMLVLLRVPSSCQPEHIDHYVMSHFTKWFVFTKGSVIPLCTQTVIIALLLYAKKNKQWADVAIYNKITNVSTINLVGCGRTTQDNNVPQVA